MPAPFLLDTNAYVLFFQNPRTASYGRLIEKLKAGSEVSFYLPEIVSMEVHSVLGGYRRGGNRAQNAACERQVLLDEQIIQCSHVCVFPQKKQMKAKVFRDLQKVIYDIEQQRGDIKATVLPLTSADMQGARELLIEFSDRFSFGSHDALVAGSLLTLRKQGIDLTLVTSDRGLKAVMKENGIPTFDPDLPEAALVTR